MSIFSLEEALETARAAVDAASVAALAHFAASIAVEKKPDRSPVTRADKEAEAAILRVIRSRYPTHAVLAEETGAHAGDADFRWIVDPLDGTRGFARGGSFWGPLVALEHHGEIVVGAMALPALGEKYWAASGMGAFRDGVRLKVSGVDSLSDSTLSLGQVTALLSEERGQAILALMQTCDSVRAFGDLASVAMLLNGRADLWMETSVQPWDLAPLKVLVEEAGGRFTDLSGKATVHSGNALATNGILHEEVLRRLSQSAKEENRLGKSAF